MTVKRLLFILSLGLIAWLFIESTSQLDIAATKNNGLTSMKKQEVEEIKNLDSVKAIAKTNFDIIRNNTKKNSDLASKRLWIIFAIGVLQLVILFKYRKSNQR